MCLYTYQEITSIAVFRHDLLQWSCTDFGSVCYIRTYSVANSQAVCYYTMAEGVYTFSTLTVAIL